jgi:hypothetical protein
MAMLVLVVPPFVAWLPRLVGARWPHLLNVPNREYWLALERRAGTLAGVVARTELLAGVLVAMFCFVHWLVLRANAAASPRLDEALFLYGIGAFIAFLIGWIVAFYARFRR